MEDRPQLRKLFTAAPETVARQTSADHAARVSAYLETHALPDAISGAIRRHEIWLGMSRAEVFLSVGAPGGADAAWTDTGRSLSYSGEGWHLKFDESGYLIEFVEH